MRNSNLFEAITEGIPEILLFGLFTAICVTGGVRAIKRLRRYRKGGTRVEAEILGYRKEKLKSGRYSDTIHFVTLRCPSPDDGKTHIYILHSNAYKARRYEKLELAEVCFIPGEREPVLPEDMTHIGIDSVLGVFGTIFCGLFTLLLIFALYCTIFRPEELLDKLHEFFMRRA